MSITNEIKKRSFDLMPRPGMLPGETFYTNFKKEGTTLKGEFVSLNEYVESLREKFSVVRVSSVAMDEDGRELEEHVAIFVQRE